MEAGSKPSDGPWLAAIGKIDWIAVSTWLLGFVLVVYLGLKGGGFDPLVSDQVGVAIWWVLLATVAVGATPRQKLGTLAWWALGLLAAFVIWTALSLTWTESAEKTSGELARVASYLGVFALALIASAPGGARRMTSAVGTGIVVVAVVALLSRLHPAWFPAANQTAQFLSIGRERLSYPLNYWNALAALIAIGLPLMLQVATDAKHLALRALAAGTIPALILTALFTLSRGGIAASFLSLAIFIAFTSDRLPKLLTLIVSGAGGAVLVAGAIQRESLRHGLSDGIAHHQGNEMLLWAIVVCTVVALLQAAISRGLERGIRPSWAHVSRRHSLIVLVAACVVVLAGLAAVNAPSKAANAWSEFKQPEVPGNGTERLSKASGESRYQFWSSAVREMQSKPLTGTGSGTFEFWWTRDGDTADVVQDAHSLYLQTLGELGIVGLALIASFLLTVLIGGAIATIRASEPGRPPLAAALAGCVAFCFTATFDWMWQVPVLPVATLLLASVLVTSTATSSRGRPLPFPVPTRVAVTILALVAIVAIAIPLASTALIRQSQADAKSGDPTAALADAKSAQNVQPYAATPRLQQALVLESEGDLPAAAGAARGATERESTNWRLWMVLSRIEAERGRAGAAIGYYRKAHSLNPNSPLFSQ
jgi:O-Antigen ligase